MLDDYNRQGLLVAPGFSLTALRVTRILDELALHRGYPDFIRVDNGPELQSYEFKNWADKHGVFINYIQPGKPAQNGFIERLFKGKLPDFVGSHINFGE